jgi:hypothetical protein
MLEYPVVATHLDAHGSVAKAKQATVPLDTDLAGRADALIQPNFRDAVRPPVQIPECCG